MKFYWFGDSWVAGDELYLTVPYEIHQQYAFPKLVSDHYGAECVNLGKTGESVDILPWRLDQVVDQISAEDEVFFFLTADARTVLFDEQGELKKIVPSPGFDNPTFHQYSQQWYRYFDSQPQRLYNYDRTVLLLYLWCCEKGIRAWFANIFTTQPTAMINRVPDSEWLIPRDRCLAQAIFPVIDNNVGILITHDFESITLEQWHQQRPQLELYLHPNHAHPNCAGHQKLAEYIIQCRNDRLRVS
jgi:hypothetical protein